jgi:lysophospholipase L1-like esterase
MSQSTQSGARRLRRAAILAVATMAALAAFAGAARAASYVALGDSYAAGPLVPSQTAPLGCLRSDHNYAHLAAPAIGLSLRDRSCSGARTGDMTHPQELALGGLNPAQLDSLGRGTKVVSLTIGGNDIGFSEIALGCIAIDPFAAPCMDRYDSGGRDLVAERIAAAAPKVAAVLRGIHARSPRARVFVVNYAAIFPETGPGCWPQMPMGYGDVPYLRSKERELNAMLAAQAAAGGATLVDWYRASIGHDACEDPSTRWVEPVLPANPAAPIHPNLAGMQGAADALVEAVG